MLDEPVIVSVSALILADREDGLFFLALITDAEDFSDRAILLLQEGDGGLLHRAVQVAHIWLHRGLQFYRRPVLVCFDRDVHFILLRRVTGPSMVLLSHDNRLSSRKSCDWIALKMSDLRRMPNKSLLPMPTALAVWANSAVVGAVVMAELIVMFMFFCFFICFALSC